MKATPSPDRGHARRAARLSMTAVALVLTAPLFPALAQEAEELMEGQFEDPIEAPGRPKLRFLGEGGMMYQGEADIDGRGGASMQVSRYDAGVMLGTELTDKLRWNNTFFMAVNDYDFDGGGFSAGNPWETILFNRFGSQLSYQLDEKWSVRGGGIFMFSRETDTDWGSGFSGGGIVGVDYRANKTLFFSLGLAVISQIEDDATVAPSIGLNWQPCEKWAFRVGTVPASGGAAGGAEAEYALTDHWSLGLGLLYAQRRFRLDDSGVAPDGVGEENTIPLRLRVGWKIHEKITLNFIGGVVLGGQLELDDEDGNRMRREDYDPAPFFGVRVLGRF